MSCDSCGFEGVKTQEYSYCRRHPVDRTKEKMNLCKLCAGTPAGNAFEYPEQYDNRDILKTICYVGNIILKAVGEEKENAKKP